MKAIVCVKQVPDTSGKVAYKPDGTLDRASMDVVTNPDDLNALEAALTLKDETGCEVVVISKYTYGGFSGSVKGVFDRCLGYVLPQFEITKGETHHKKRFDEDKPFTFICCK